MAIDVPPVPAYRRLGAEGEAPPAFPVFAARCAEMKHKEAPPTWRRSAVFGWRHLYWPHYSSMIKGTEVVGKRETTPFSDFDNPQKPAKRITPVVSPEGVVFLVWFMYGSGVEAFILHTADRQMIPSKGSRSSRYPPSDSASAGGEVQVTKGQK